MNATFLYINLQNLTDNINFIKSLKSAKNKNIIAIVKSDAYGHGIIPTTDALFKNGIDFFGIINMDEANDILKKIPSARILMLMGLYDNNEIDEALSLNLRISAINLDNLKIILSRAKKLNKTANIHIKFDSGMNRLGFNDAEIKSAIKTVNENKKFLKVEGLFSHLSSAGNDIDYTNFQIAKYKKILTMLEENNIKPIYTHISASSSILNDGIKDDYSNAIRPGISIYGINPNSNERENRDSGKELKPLMTLRAIVLQVKKVKKGDFISYNNTFKAPKNMTIAVISAGYDNGIPRLLSNKGRFLINGMFADIKGIVTMNLTMVDITKIEGVKPGDEVTIVGKQGLNEITMEEIASLANTIPYEICLNLGKSNKRVYVK